MLYTSQHQARRRGVILMIVLSMLTLFAIVGITFVLYATAEAASTNAGKQAEQLFIPDIEPEMALAMFLGQQIYGVPDPTSTNGPPFSFSALRGHDFARLMYGYSGPGGQDNMAFTGVGRYYQTPPPVMTDASTLPASFNSTAYLVNFQPFLNAGGTLIDNFLFDPERFCSTIPALAGARGMTTPDSNSVYTGGGNVPYTFPDHQNMFLAQLRSSDGMVIMPSFHRPWLFGQWTAPVAPATNNTNNNVGKYLTCFVRPQEMGPGFPTPDQNGLSVKNLGNGPGSSFFYPGVGQVQTSNDSGWIDIGAPVITAPNGQKYKMLVAPLIIELDSKLDLNVLGNIIGTGNTHASYQGWGPSEVNLSKVLNSAVSANEWKNIFIGNTPGGYGTTTNSRTLGRYGPRSLPAGAGLSGGTSARWWAPVDYNGTKDQPPAALPTGLTMLLPANGGVAPLVPYQVFPTFDSGVPTTYNNGVPNETTDSSGTPLHPLGYNAWRPLRDNRRLPLASLMPLYRQGDTNTDALTSELYRLCPQNFLLDNTAPTPLLSGVTNALTAIQRRNLVTLLSADLDRPAGTPYIIDPTDATTHFRYTTTYGAPSWSPLTPTSQAQISYPLLQPRATPPGTGDFDPTTLRSIAAQVGRVDLNRSLTNYPAPDATTGIIDLTVAANVTQYQQALADRQQFALDLFTALRKSVGALDPVTVLATFPGGPTTPEYRGLRYLAQLAVNIVDYIDYDDYITPFNWDPVNGSWVFGTEIPRLVINETYVSWDNDSSDPSLPAAATKYDTNVWVELHNPFVDDVTTNGFKASDGLSKLPDQKAILHSGTNPAYTGTTWPNYILVIADQNLNPLLHQNLRDPANVTGDPDFPTLPVGVTTSIRSTLTDYVPTNIAGLTPAQQAQYRVVLPNNNNYVEPTAAPAPRTTGFYVLGPDPPNHTFATTTLPAAYNSDPKLPVTSAVNGTNGSMSFALANTDLNFAITPNPTILLRRLACPGLQPNPPINSGGVTNGTFGPLNPALPYNPYITVDYTEVNGTLETNDGRFAKPTPVVTLPSTTTFRSWGRQQPYMVNQRKPQSPNTQGPPPQPKHTFFRQNALEDAPAVVTPPQTNPIPTPTVTGETLQVPFDWLTHLDRQLISPMELLHVSGFKPHELTQQFVDSTGTHFAHRAPWYDQTTRLHRFFEFVETKSRASGMAPGGRLPGRININMVNDQEILQALADSPSLFNPPNGSGANYFTQYDILAVYNQMVQSRSPSGALTFTGLEQPFWGMAVGQAPGSDAMSPLALGGRGISNTYLRTAPTSAGGTWPQFAFEPYNLSGGGTITNASNATPIQITTMSAHGLTTGQSVTISGVMGNTAANNAPPGTSPQWIVTFVDSTNFTISDPANGTGVAGNGMWIMPGMGMPTPTWTPFVPPSPAGSLPSPYLRQQMLTKIYNNLTTRSNVFAVWLTCGFFEVSPTSTGTPVQLGAEVGSAEGRQVRHRLFAIVDRSQMQVFNTTLAGSTAAFTGTTGQITAATNSASPAPIQITSNGHGLSTGQAVSITGVGGNTGANGYWIITFVDANNFTLNASTGTGAYTTGGTWSTVNAPQPIKLAASSTYGSTTLSPYTGFNPSTGRSWAIQPNTVLTVDPNLSGNISNATNASPIQITSNNHGLVTNQTVVIGGVGGNTAANGTWVVTVVDANNFTLANASGTAATGNGAYASGTGSWATNSEETVVLPQDGGAITTASNATPIQITTAALHGLYVGQVVIISGVTGNTAANGTWQVLAVVDGLNFTLQNLSGAPAAGNGAYVSGGTWFTPTATFTKAHAAGVAVVNRGNPGPYQALRGTITNATNATPIQITSANHGLTTGQQIVVSGVQGNTAANNNTNVPPQTPSQWTVTVVDANNFTLNTSVGNAAYTLNTGTWYAITPRYDPRKDPLVVPFFAAVH